MVTLTEKSLHLLFPLAKFKNCATISFFICTVTGASAELAELARSRNATAQIPVFLYPFPLNMDLCQIRKAHQIYFKTSLFFSLYHSSKVFCQPVFPMWSAVVGMLLTRDPAAC